MVCLPQVRALSCSRARGPIQPGPRCHQTCLQERTPAVHAERCCCKDEQVSYVRVEEKLTGSGAGEGY